jgi:hypothetical protein
VISTYAVAAELADAQAEQHFPSVKWPTLRDFFIPLALIGVENAIGPRIYEVDM